jgi:excisionase family DNA binding protein
MRLLTFDEVCERLRVSRDTVTTMVDRGEFIQPLQIAPRRVAFLESEFEEWIATRPRGKMPWAESLRKKHQAKVSA